MQNAVANGFHYVHAVSAELRRSGNIYVVPGVRVANEYVV